MDTIMLMFLDYQLVLIFLQVQRYKALGLMVSVLVIMDLDILKEDSCGVIVIIQ